MSIISISVCHRPLLYFHTDMTKTNKALDFRHAFALMQGIIFLCCFKVPAIAFATPLFDVHLHYNQSDAEVFSPQDVVSILKRNNVRYAVVTSRPPELALQLHRQSPDLIIPMLGVYQTPEDKARWFYDVDLPDRLEAQLKKGDWRAIGELHLFAKQRYQPVFKKIIKLAVDYRLPLNIHADPAVIDAIYELAPGHPVIWAHAGTFPYPDLLADYLRRYPQLHVDLSVRDERIAPDGKLSDVWYDLLLQFPKRFMVGVDTYSTNRWKKFDQVADRIRKWVSQLPVGIAHQIAFDNADRVLRHSLTERIKGAGGIKK